MACLMTFDNNVTTGLLSGNPSTVGVWEFIGYSTTVGGTYAAGGNFPNETPSYGDSVDASNVTPGFYKFKYKSNLLPGDPCYDDIEIIIPIMQGSTDIGTDQVFNICSGDAPHNIYNDSILYAESASNPATFAIEPPAGVGAAYVPNASGITDDEYDPSLEPSYPITRIFTIRITPNTPLTFTNSSCDNCVEKTQTVTYNVTEQFDPGTASLKAFCNDGDI